MAARYNRHCFGEMRIKQAAHVQAVPILANLARQKKPLYQGQTTPAKRLIIPHQKKLVIP